jgi:starch phosphorylase
VLYPRYDFAALPLEDSGRRVRVPLGRRTLEARIWKARVGRTLLLLLDSDTRPNPPALRRVTGQLYGGDDETRIQQEILLGIGGVRALAALGLRATVFHLNEGHAALAGLERLRELRREGRPLARALEAVRRTSLFTTHTPVPAGHDRFSPALTMRYLGPLAEELGMEREAFLGLGRQDPSDPREPFCMTVLALRLSAHCNAVAELHGRTTRRMWMGVYGARRERDVPIGHVTNGVHVQTWLAPEMAELYERYLRPRWLGAGPQENFWHRAARIPPAELWAVRNALRARLVQFVRRRLVEQVQRRLGSAGELWAARQALDERALTIGFARRFATYKRATLIFHDPQRLAAILNHPERPVQLVFAGKAHPRDLPGQALAQQIFRMIRREEFRGRVVLLEDYDMEVGRVLTSGCDVWLNTPLRPQEASGTSGMKPPLHGGLNCSILDGWWPEGYNGRNGWAIGDARERATRREQDSCDAAALYELLEREIVPLFYRRDRRGLPRGWILRMIESLRTIPQRFNSHRMVAEYFERFYRLAAAP